MTVAQDCTCGSGLGIIGGSKVKNLSPSTALRFKGEEFIPKDALVGQLELILTLCRAICIYIRSNVRYNVCTNILSTRKLLLRRASLFAASIATSSTRTRRVEKRGKITVVLLARVAEADVVDLLEPRLGVRHVPLQRMQ